MNSQAAYLTEQFPNLPISPAFNLKPETSIYGGTPWAKPRLPPDASSLT